MRIDSTGNVAMSGTAAVTGVPTLTIAPTGNPGATLAGLNVQTSTASASRVFGSAFGLTSTGGTADKVTLYAGMVCQAGTFDCWSLNSVHTQEAASGSYNAQGYELDFNNLNAHRGEADGGAGLSAPVSYGLSITGAGTFRSTAALGIYGNGFYGDGTITSITRSGTTATVTTTGSTTYPTGLDVTITGAEQAEYNGSHTITVINPTTFTYVVSGSPATPATTKSSLLSSVPLWNRGLMFVLNAISATGSAIQDLGTGHFATLDIRGHPTYGIYQPQPTPL